MEKQNGINTMGSEKDVEGILGAKVVILRKMFGQLFLFTAHYSLTTIHCSLLILLSILLSGGAAMAQTIHVTSDAFREGEMIPAQYTCDGRNINPSLRWSGAPKETQSFVILSDDPDAPGGDWVHWVLYDLPPTINMVPEALPPHNVLVNNEKHGKNDFGRVGYGGPCPPGGTHRYFFKVYALDAMLNLPAGKTKKEILKAMEGHILAEGGLMGKYQRKK